MRRCVVVVRMGSSRGFPGEENSVILHDQKKQSIAVRHYGETSPGVFQKILKLIGVCTSILNMGLSATL